MLVRVVLYDSKSVKFRAMLALGWCVGGRSPGRRLVLLSLCEPGCGLESEHGNALRGLSVLVCSKGGAALLRHLLTLNGQPTGSWHHEASCSQFSVGRNGETWKQSDSSHWVYRISTLCEEEMAGGYKNLLPHPGAFQGEGCVCEFLKGEIFKTSLSLPQ